MAYHVCLTFLTIITPDLVFLGVSPTPLSSYGTPRPGRLRICLSTPSLLIGMLFILVLVTTPWPVITRCWKYTDIEIQSMVINSLARNSWEEIVDRGYPDVEWGEFDFGVAERSSMAMNGRLHSICLRRRDNMRTFARWEFKRSIVCFDLSKEVFE